MTNKLNQVAYATSIGLAAFSGSVATYGLTKFAPGAFAIVIVMGILFEAGKLTSFALLHRQSLPRSLKVALLTIGSVLVLLNIAGVSGQLSSSYVHRQIEGQVASHKAQSAARADVNDLASQLAQIDATIAEANSAKIKARDDRDRKRAADAILKQAHADRDALSAKLSEARAQKASAEGDAMNAASEFAAVAFIAHVSAPV